MKKNKVLILSHIPTRDRNFDMMLAQELEPEQHVWLRELLKQDRQIILLLKPNVLVVPEIRNEYTLNLCKNVREWGGKVVVRMCEMGITEESLPYISDSYRKAIFGNHDINDAVDILLCWGEKQAELMQSQRGVRKEKIQIVGAPILDPVFYPLPEIKRDERPTVLFATGFPYADRNEQYSLPEANEGDPVHKELARIDKKSRAEWLKMIQAFYEKYRHRWKILVKCHTGETPAVYEAVLRDVPVDYVHNQSSVSILPIIDVVVHAGSTIALEADLLGKPCFNYQNKCQDVLLSKVSPQIDTMDELLVKFDKLELGKSNANMDVIKKLEAYVGFPDGQVHKRCASIISSIPYQDNSIPNSWPADGEFHTKDSDLIPFCENWKCDACGKIYFVTNRHREMVKCPYCGIANVKRQIQRQPQMPCNSNGKGRVERDTQKKSDRSRRETLDSLLRPGS